VADTVWVNVDAAFFLAVQANGCTGVGVVSANHNGGCLAACVIASELHALALIPEKGHDRFMLATDCLSVVRRINSFTLDCLLLGVVIHDSQ
jgi:hypothetical protein